MTHDHEHLSRRQRGHLRDRREEDRSPGLRRHAAYRTRHPGRARGPRRVRNRPNSTRPRSRRSVTEGRWATATDTPTFSKEPSNRDTSLRSRPGPAARPAALLLSAERVGQGAGRAGGRRQRSRRADRGRGLDLAEGIGRRPRADGRHDARPTGRTHRPWRRDQEPSVAAFGAPETEEVRNGIVRCTDLTPCRLRGVPFTY